MRFLGSNSSSTKSSSESDTTNVNAAADDIESNFKALSEKQWK